MSTSRPRRVSRRTAEQLLRGARAGQRGAGGDAVADLLAAAAAPGREDELARQPAALAAFRSARLSPVPQRRRRSVIKSVLATSLTAKIAAVAVVAVSFGGVATAAVTGYLPVHPGPATNAPPAASTTTGTPTRSSPVSAAPVVTTTSAAAPSGDGHASPAPDLVGLCHAYTAGAGNGNALPPAFTDLADVAGGRAKVAAYCASLLRGQHSTPPSHGAPATQHGSTPHPTPPSHPHGASGTRGHQ